jgi:hypothetical protein
MARWHVGTKPSAGGGKDEQLCSIETRILQSHGLNYSSREIELFSAQARKVGDFRADYRFWCLIQLNIKFDIKRVRFVNYSDSLYL